MQVMTTDEIAAFHDNLADVLAREGEDAAQAYLQQHLQRLPEGVRNEIVARMFFQEIVNEAQEIEESAKVREEGLKAIEVLERLKAELQKSEGSSQNRA